MEHKVKHLLLEKDWTEPEILTGVGSTGWVEAFRTQVWFLDALPEPGQEFLWIREGDRDAGERWTRDLDMRPGNQAKYTGLSWPVPDPATACLLLLSLPLALRRPRAA